MPARTASPDDIDVTSILGTLKKSLPRILLMSAVLGALTYAALMTVAPKFQSQSEMTIVAKGSASPFNDPKNAGPESLSIKMDKEAINTHVRALQSPELVTKIADELKLKDKREFNSALGPVDLFDKLMRMVGIGGPRAGESDRDRVLNALFKQLEVYSAKESRFIGVRVTSVDPQLAADIANSISEAYRTSLAAAATQEVDDAQNVIKGKIEKLTPEVAAAETEVDRYRGEINVFKGGAQNTGLIEQQLSELTAELTKAKSARSEAEARAKAARDMMKTGSADALPDVQKSPLIQNLVQQRVRIERQISELSATLLPGHPRMQQLNADLAGLKKQLTAEVSKLVESLDREAKVTQGREESIKKSIDEIKAGVVTNAPGEAKLRQLEANAKAKRTELESLQAQLEANRKRLDARAQPVEAQIISKAQAASLPVSPRKGQSAALVAFAGLLLGTFWTITRALFVGARGGNAGAKPQNDSEAFEIRVEPALPGKKDAKLNDLKKSARAAASAAATVDKPNIAAVAERLISAAPAQGGHRAMVTGETVGVDAAADAIALAKSIGERGRHVILINWSTSGQSMAAQAGVTAGKGMTDLVLGAGSFEDVVHRLPGSTVHFIASGSPFTADADVDPDQLNLVLDALDEAYDHIIVTGQHGDCRNLFEAIQGRFDAGIVVRDNGKGSTALNDPSTTFLGFEVAGMEVIRIQRSVPETPPAERLMRAGLKPKAGRQTRLAS